MSLPKPKPSPVIRWRKNIVGAYEDDGGCFIIMRLHNSRSVELQVCEPSGARGAIICANLRDAKQTAEGIVRRFLTAYGAASSQHRGTK